MGKAEQLEAFDLGSRRRTKQTAFNAYVQRKVKTMVSEMTHKPTGRLPRKEKKEVRKMLKVDKMKRFKIIKKSVDLKTGDFKMRLSKY